MRLRVPWSEIAALLAGYVAIAAWSAAGEPVTAEGVVTAVLALAAALAPRRALTGPAPALAEAAAITGALAAVAIATTVAGPVPPRPVLGLVHAVATGEVLALATALAVALPLRPSTLRRAIVPAVVVGMLATWGLWPRTLDAPGFPGATALAPAAALAMALAYAHAVRRPHSPAERARLVAPGLGAAALAAAVVVAGAQGAWVSPLVMALGLVALVVGMTVGTGAIALETSARFARRTLAAAAGFGVGVALVNVAPVGAVAVGALVMLLALPVFERHLRPDGGALLDACDAVDRALPRVQNLTDLAAAVLDPLREAAGDLRAPAALWVLGRAEVLRLDVAGSPGASRLALEAERAILSWLRSRPGPLFADTLRPHLVRRPELRPVVAALDDHESLAAVPLRDDGELAGVLLVPRGRRREVPTYEEEVRLDAMARSVSGALALVNAMERANERARRAVAEAVEAEGVRAAAVAELTHLGERDRGVRCYRGLGTLDEEWVGYSPAMRALAARVAALGDGDDPVALVAEAGAGTLAVARALHAHGPRAEGPLVVLDGASVHPRDALPALVGDARWDPPHAGWLEHARGGTLVIEELPALGYDAHVALLDALRTGVARRVGGVGTYEARVRLVVAARRPPGELDLPAELIARLAPATLDVPPLRARPEDLESLVMIGLDRACRIAGRSTLGITPEALAALRGYNWPGNVRELHEVLEHAVARARGSRAALEDLPVHIRGILRAAARDDEPDAGGAHDDDDFADDEM